jgi:hypothetical protein
MREFEFQPGGKYMLQLALRGFHGSKNRLARAAGMGDVEASFHAATEALWWACALDEQFIARSRPHRNTPGWYELQREQDYSGRVLRGMRYARNRTTHALPMTISEGDFFMEEFTDDFRGLAWQPLEALPEPPDEHRAAEDRSRYGEVLAGRDVEGTLDRAATWFGSLQNDVRANFGDPLPSTRPPWDDGR